MITLPDMAALAFSAGYLEESQKLREIIAVRRIIIVRGLLALITSYSIPIEIIFKPGGTQRLGGFVDFNIGERIYTGMMML